MKQKQLGWAVILMGVSLNLPAHASSGTEGAAFLDIPVGAGPAALGASYTALARDAYSPTYNPGGLGMLESTQFSGQHLSYLDSLHYEYLSFAVPLPRSTSCANAAECNGSALGGSIQYLGTGDIDGLEADGTTPHEFSSYYASYNLSYGRSLSDKLSLGVTGKMIKAKLDDVSGSAYAADLGGMYQMQKNLTIAATVMNLGSKLKFLDEGDSLPLAFHLGAAYNLNPQWLFTGEVVYPKTGLASFHMGSEWRPLDLLAVRLGYRTDTVKELSPLAGLSAGMGLNVWGQELAYAWLPYGDLGNTHYISLLMKFGEVERSQRNLIQYKHVKVHRANKAGDDDMAPDYTQLMELLNDGERHLAQQHNNNTNSSYNNYSKDLQELLQ